MIYHAIISNLCKFLLFNITCCNNTNGWTLHFRSVYTTRVSAVVDDSYSNTVIEINSLRSYSHRAIEINSLYFYSLRLSYLHNNAFHCILWSAYGFTKVCVTSRWRHIQLTGWSCWQVRQYIYPFSCDILCHCESFWWQVEMKDKETA